jgi:hypothetical protein
VLGTTPASRATSAMVIRRFMVGSPIELFDDPDLLSLIITKESYMPRLRSTVLYVEV